MTTSAELVSRVAEGMPRENALAALVAACNRPDTLFITEKWIAPRRERLSALLSDPITADEAHVLREILWQRLPFEVVFDWLAEKPVTWNDYQATKAAMAEQSRWRTMAEGIFPWPDVEASKAAGETAGAKHGPCHEELRNETCPCCNRPLTWIYFRSPKWTWKRLCGRAGWLGVCDECHLQVRFSLEVMN
jgi:hypothetical protein